MSLRHLFFNGYAPRTYVISLYRSVVPSTFFYSIYKSRSSVILRFIYSKLTAASADCTVI